LVVPRACAPTLSFGSARDWRVDDPTYGCGRAVQLHASRSEQLRCRSAAEKRIVGERHPDNAMSSLTRHARCHWVHMRDGGRLLKAVNFVASSLVSSCSNITRHLGRHSSARYRATRRLLSPFHGHRLPWRLRALTPQPHSPTLVLQRAASHLGAYPPTDALPAPVAACGSADQ